MAELAKRALRNKEARVVVAFSAANLLVGLGSNRLLTEAIAPARLGELYLFTNLAQWLGLPATTSYLYVVRYWQVAREGGEVGAFWRALRGGIAFQFAFALIGAVCFWLAGSVQLGAGGAILLAISAGAAGTAQVLDPLPTGERRRTTVGLLGLAGSPARQGVLALAGLLLGQVSLASLAVVHTAHAVLLAVVTFLVAAGIANKASAGAKSSTFQARKEITPSGYMRYVWPFFFTAILTQVAASSERWGLAKLSSPSATAVFVQAVGLSMAGAGAATSFLNSYFIPIIAQAAGAKAAPVASAGRHLRRYILLTLGLLAVFAGCMSVLAGPLTSLLFGARYAAVARYLPLTAIGASLFAGGQALGMVAFTAKEAVTPNAARWVSLAVYSILLWVASGTSDPVFSFSWSYVAANGLYAALMAASAGWHLRGALGAKDD